LELSRRVFFAAMAIGSLAVALAVSSVAYLPTNDGPQHVLSGFLQKAFSEPGTPYHALLEPLPEFAERGFSLLFVPLLEVFAWRLALRVTLVVIALSGAWSFAALACALGKRRTPWALLGFAFAFPWTFYMGFLPFVLAANVGVAIVAYAVQREQPRRTTLAILSTMLLIDAVLHVGAAVTTGLVVLLVFLLRAPAGRRLRAFGVVALVGVPAASVLAGVLLSSARGAGTVEPWAWTPFWDHLVELPRYAVPGPMPRALAGCTVVVCGLVVGLRRAARREASRAELAVLAMALLFIACAIAGPIDLPGWQLVAPRFASLGVPLAASLLVSVRPTRSPRVVLGAIVALTAVSLGLTYDFHRRLSRGCEPALAGLASDVNLSGFTLPVPLDAYCGVSSNPKASEVPHLAPLFHVGALYAVARGGFTPYMFGGSSAIHAFRYRSGALESGGPPPPPPRLYLALVGPEGRTDPATREYLIARFAEYGIAHDHLLVVGAREGELASILARGYAADWQTDSAMIAHPRPCMLDVLLDVDDARGVLVEIGERPAGEVVFAMRAESAEVLPDGKRRLRFTKGACGPVWVRGFADVDGSGHASKGDVFCAGAGRDGSLAVDVTSQAELRCRIETPARGAPR
jgi:hypothetical protein